MNAQLATAPTIEPITLTELKLHLGIEDYLQDSLLTDLITTARVYVEQITRRQLLTATWDYYLDEFPSCDYFKLPFGNLATVTHIKYTDSDSTQTTMTVTTDYIVETNKEQYGRIVLPYGDTWPSFTAYTSNPIVVRFVCGWTAAANVPTIIRTAVKMIAAKLYMSRGDDFIGQVITEDKFYLNLLNPYRLWDEIK